MVRMFGPDKKRWNYPTTPVLVLTSLGERLARDKPAIAAAFSATRLVEGASDPAAACGRHYINHAGTLTQQGGISWPIRFELSVWL